MIFQYIQFIGDTGCLFDGKFLSYEIAQLLFSQNCKTGSAKNLQSEKMAIFRSKGSQLGGGFPRLPAKTSGLLQKLEISTE